MSKGMIDPDDYTAEMKTAVEQIMFEEEPERKASKEAAKVLYSEIKEMLPLRAPSTVAAEAISVGRELFPFENLQFQRRRDASIRKVISIEMARDIAKQKRKRK